MKRYFIYHYHPKCTDEISAASMVKVDEHHYDAALAKAIDDTRIKPVIVDSDSDKIEEFPKATKVEVYHVREGLTSSDLELVFTLYAHRDPDYVNQYNRLKESIQNEASV